GEHGGRYLEKKTRGARQSSQIFTGDPSSGRESTVQQPTAKSGDNTALNAIRLYCTFPDSQDKQETITSTVGGAGTWGDEYWCPSGNLKYFILRVQAPQDEGDDTAANNILMICSDSTVLEPKGGQLGTFGKISGKCSSGICAIQTRLEPSQGPEEDDTQLNDVKFRCC
ncbi:vitelline membrane outer layer protein 1 homolog, partial [Hyla sarda]|uniref:vitelline membrane outer layer protein 1 homolog n=1 Tax=Hyla sarda TaxID=327740 RepID=UPI0024C241AE